jgi:hypothetical protein
MGCDWYSVYGEVCYGIVVSNNDIKEVHKPGSSPASDDEKVLDDPLNRATKEWLVQQTAGFRIYDVCSAFVLITKDDEQLIKLPELSMPGPYDIEFHPFDISVTPGRNKDVVDKDLFDIACKLTPEGNKLSFEPGTCCFHYTAGGVSDISSDLKHKGTVESMDDEKPEANANPFISLLKQEDLPTDLALVVGCGDLQKTFRVNRAVLCYFIPGFDCLVDDGDKGKEQLQLPDLDPNAVEAVIDYHTTRGETRAPFPPEWGMCDGEKNAINKVYKVLQPPEEPEAKRAKKAAAKSGFVAQQTDERFLDATFLVGPNRTDIKGNRAVLAAMNQVLKLCLYGTGIITVDPSKPIEWAEFEAEAVRLVFESLGKRGKTEFVIPETFVDSARRFAHFIGETEETLNLYFDTPYKRDYFDGAALQVKYREKEEEEEWPEAPHSNYYLVAE